MVVTTAPKSPAAQRKQRERQYMIMMGIRMVCFLLIFAVPGFWKLVMIGLAVVLPGIAVILANAVDRRRQNTAALREPSDSPELTSGVVLEADEDYGGDHRQSTPHQGQGGTP
ncbi:Protein of unknown function (DUF3099) [Naumannella halotolerans]|uniref:DUF3099 family protein n=1 Tax=Naumannella halotolerans TaxID=993414 RepID=A0A4R7J681_9ACTN|nr:Protein of unknown function (DUF3099) [Naumannella halotolerans]